MSFNVKQYCFVNCKSFNLNPAQARKVRLPFLLFVYTFRVNKIFLKKFIDNLWKFDIIIPGIGFSLDWIRRIKIF